MILGITTIQRDRAPWIAEWVTFHYLVGFRKFYIYLHECSDNTKDILLNLKKNLDINILDPEETATPQLKCYNHAYHKYGDQIDWMAFIDGDEFLFPTNSDSIEKELSFYSDKNISALGVYWSCFGSSGFIDEPKGLIIENYKYRAFDGYHNNRHIKSIVKGKQGELVRAGDPHIFSTPLGTFDENLRPIDKGWTNYEPTYQKFRINHYVTQSRSYFENFKKIHSMPDGCPPRDESYWEEHNKNDILDNSMNRFIKPLKSTLANI